MFVHLCDAVLSILCRLYCYYVTSYSTEILNANTNRCNLGSNPVSDSYTGASPRIEACARLQQPVICLIPGCGCGLMTGTPAGTGGVQPFTARMMYRLAAGDMQLQGCCTRRFDETALTGMFHDENLINYLTYGCNFYTRM